MFFTLSISNSLFAPHPTFRKLFDRFEQELKETVTLSDRLGYIYWFAVLTTISCGFATGIYVTIINRTAMVQSCQQKFEALDDFLTSHPITSALNDSHRSNHSCDTSVGEMEASIVGWNRADGLGMPDNIDLLIDRIDEMSDEIR